MMLIMITSRKRHQLIRSVFLRSERNGSTDGTGQEPGRAEAGTDEAKHNASVAAKA